MNNDIEIIYELFYCNNFMRIFKTLDEVDEFIKSSMEDYKVLFDTQFKVIERIYDKNGNLKCATIIPFLVGGINE